MSGPRRNRLKVITDILMEALNGSNKTRIMQRANLNHHRFDRYFSELLTCGVIVKGNVEGRIVYQTTEKGLNLIKTICRAEEILGHNNLT
jgi:predicted transcriptional regulator